MPLKHVHTVRAVLVSNEWAVTLEPEDCEYDGRNDSLHARH